MAEPSPRVSGDLPPLSGDGLAVSPGGAVGPAGGIRESRGRYIILQHHAHGGLGQISVALDQSLDRKVALKEIRPELAANARTRTRFIHEAEITGQLEHPGIVPVYSFGQDDQGRPYYIMKFVEGRTFDEVVAQYHAQPTPVAFLDLLRRFVAVCDAVAYAHHQGIIHRDLKPANIMVGKYGETLILDWGLAKRIGDGQDPLDATAAEAFAGHGSVEGRIVGTPGYMAPEQARGQTAQAGAASDIYSLGAVLYQILTGQPPYQGGTKTELLARVTSQRPMRPMLVKPNTPAPLEAVCLKAMARGPEDRYGSAEELAREINRWLADEPVEAYAERWHERLTRWGRNHKPMLAGIIALLVTAVFALALSTGLVVRAQLRAETNFDEAQSQRSKLQGSLGRERVTSYLNSIAAAFGEWQTGSVLRARQILDECPIDLREWEWQYLSRLCRTELLSFIQHSSDVRQAVFSPDGRLIASVSMESLKVWEAQTGRVILDLGGHGGWGGAAVAFSPDGKLLASGGYQTIKLWDMGSGREVLSIAAHDHVVTGLAFAPDGQRLASCSGRFPADAVEAGQLRVWDVVTGRMLADVAQRHWGQSVAFSPDGKYLACGVGNLSAAAEASGEIELYDGVTYSALRRLSIPRGCITCVAFTPDGQTLAGSSTAGSVTAWETATGRELFSLHGADKAVLAIAFSPDGASLASAGEDQIIRLWSASTGQGQMSLRGHTNPINSLSFRGDGKQLASAAGSGQIAGEVKVWEVAEQESRVWRNHSGAVVSACWSGDGSVIATASSPGEAILRFADTGREIWRIGANGEFPAADGFHAIALGSGGGLLAGSGEEGVRVWDIAQKRLLWQDRPTLAPRALQFSPDGRQLIAVGSGIMIYEARTGRELHPMQGHAFPITGVTFTMDGRRFATAAWGDYRHSKGELPPSEVKIYEAGTAQELLTLPGGGLGVALSPDGKLIASGGGSGREVIVWEAASGRALHILRGHTAAVTSVSFSPDGKRLASGGEDRTIRIWDTSTGREVLTLRGHESAVRNAAFSPDGRRLLSTSGEHGEAGEVRIWDTVDRRKAAEGSAAVANKP